jgi:hypothetical protein
VSLSIYVYMALQPFLFDLYRFFSFLILYTVGRIPWKEDPLRKAATYTQNKRRQTSVPRVEFEPTTPGFERAKKDHALGRAATVICRCFIMRKLNKQNRTQVSVLAHILRMASVNSSLVHRVLIC